MEMQYKFLVKILKKIKSSAKYIQNLGVKHINLNCGCPMKKIVNCGYGAALVKEPEKIKRILSEIKISFK